MSRDLRVTSISPGSPASRTGARVVRSQLQPCWPPFAWGKRREFSFFLLSSVPHLPPFSFNIHSFLPLFCTLLCPSSFLPHSFLPSFPSSPVFLSSIFSSLPPSLFLSFSSFPPSLLPSFPSFLPPLTLLCHNPAGHWGTNQHPKVPTAALCYDSASSTKEASFFKS